VEPGGPADALSSAWAVSAAAALSPAQTPDPTFCERAQQGLASLQEADGSYAPRAATVASTEERERFCTTAHAVRALADSGFRGRAIPRALAYLSERAGRFVDPYCLAVAAGAFAATDFRGAARLETVKRLIASAESAEGVPWTPAGAEMIGAGEGTRGAETVAAAAQALAHAPLPVLDRAGAWLIDQRTPDGAWGSPLLSARVLSALSALGYLPNNGTRATIVLNGKPISRVTLGADTALPQWVDCSDKLLPGTNHLQIRASGSMAVYQIVHTCVATPG